MAPSSAQSECSEACQPTRTICSRIARTKRPAITSSSGVRWAAGVAGGESRKSVSSRRLRNAEIFARAVGIAAARYPCKAARVNAARPVAVVIPSWNSADLLPNCLGSLPEQGVELETVVVDNGSSDGTLEYLREQGVRHVPLPRNLGFAAAVNRGVAETVAPAVLVLNADAELEPGAVARL